MRDRGDIRDRQNLEAQRIQRTHGGIATRAGTLDPHFQVLDAALLRHFAGVFCRNLRRERR